MSISISFTKIEFAASMASSQTLPISDQTIFAGASLPRCITRDPAILCDSFVFGTTSVPLYDAIDFNFRNVADNSPGSLRVLFAEGSFDAPGRYVSVDGGAQLTIGVPEAATWLMLILGFGLIGTALRRRRPAAALRS